MATRKDTIFEQFLAPVLNLFIDQEAILEYYNGKDWEGESDRLRNPTLSYPEYYHLQNFHGIEGGYLTVNAAITYDPVTHYALPPHEDWVRQSLIDRIQGTPRRILDLGCGTGSTTLTLKRAYPEAEVIGLDLSPYMLLVAEDKTRTAGLDIRFCHGNAEHTGFPDSTFDLVTAALLFHETPPEIASQILREAFRLLKPDGEVLILDGNQSVLRHTDWLTEIFEEPYIKAYADGSVAAWMGAAGFEAVQTDDVWLVHQVTRGVKPLPGRSPEWSRYEEIGEEQWAMG